MNRLAPASAFHGHSLPANSSDTGADLPAAPSAYRFGNFRLDPDGLLFREGKLIHLPPKELAALRLLLTMPGQIVTPQQFKDALWGKVHVTADSVPRCLSSLRARLEPDECIQTVYKRGYRLDVDVSLLPAHGVHHKLRLAIMPLFTRPTVPTNLGMAVAEELTAHLAAHHADELALLARDSVFTLAARGLSSLDLGHTLKADLVLTGSMTRVANQFLLRFEMVRIADAVQIWSEDILIEPNRFAALQNILCRRLLFRLGLAPCHSATRPSPLDSNPGPDQIEAYKAFQLARLEWMSLERHQMQDSLQHLIRATELDPSLIEAKIKLIHLCAAQLRSGFMAPRAAANLIERTAADIPNLFQTATIALPTIGWTAFHISRNLDAARRAFDLSAHLPHDGWTTRARAHFAISLQRFDQALSLLDQAIADDPYAPALHAIKAWTLFLDGKTAPAVDLLHRSLKLFPQHEAVAFYAAIILPCADDPAALQLADDVARRLHYLDATKSFLAYALACKGQSRQAFELLDQLKNLARDRYVTRSFSAAAYLALGDDQLALHELRAANDGRCPWYFQALLDPRLKPLHGNPDFERLRLDYVHFIGSIQ